MVRGYRAALLLPACTTWLHPVPDSAMQLSSVQVSKAGTPEKYRTYGKGVRAEPLVLLDASVPGRSNFIAHCSLRTLSRRRSRVTFSDSHGRIFFSRAHPLFPSLPLFVPQPEIFHLLSGLGYPLPLVCIQIPTHHYVPSLTASTSTLLLFHIPYQVVLRIGIIHLTPNINATRVIVPRQRVLHCLVTFHLCL